MLTKITECLRACPKLAAASANFLGENAGDVGVFAIGCKPIISRYADGGSLRQFVFSVKIRTEAQTTEGEIVTLCKEISHWLSGHLPVLYEGKTPQGFEELQTPEAVGRSPGGLFYEMHYRLVYYQKGE